MVLRDRLNVLAARFNQNRQSFVTVNQQIDDLTQQRAQLHEEGLILDGQLQLLAELIREEESLEHSRRESQEAMMRSQISLEAPRES